jgi:hypothetical protein
MSRLTRAAAANRTEADRQRDAGRKDSADRLEDRADELDSGKVTDQTDTVSAAIKWAFLR